MKNDFCKQNNHYNNIYVYISSDCFCIKKQLQWHQGWLYNNACVINKDTVSQ